MVKSFSKILIMKIFFFIWRIWQIDMETICKYNLIYFFIIIVPQIINLFNIIKNLIIILLQDWNQCIITKFTTAFVIPSNVKEVNHVIVNFFCYILKFFFNIIYWSFCLNLKKNFLQDDYWCAISNLCQCSWRGAVSFSCTLPLCSCESSQKIRWLKSFNHGKLFH